MHEVSTEHLRPAHDSEELSMIAQLDVIIGSRRGGTAQPVADGRSPLGQQIPSFPVYAFEDRTLIQNDASPVGIREKMMALIVRDHDPRVSVRRMPARCDIPDAELRSLPLRLGRNCAGREAHAPAVRLGAAMARPFPLPPRLA